MTKLALMLFAGMISLGAHATGLEMSFAPTEPVVFTSDYDLGNGEIIKGPWFQNQFFFNTDAEATIVGYEVNVTSNEGATMQYTVTPDQPLSVVPGVTAHSDVLYFGELMASSSYAYSVEVHVLGYFANKTGDPSQRIDLVGTFKTQ